MNIQFNKPAGRPARPRALDLQSFPDQPKGRKDGVPCTVANVRHLLEENGITARWNLIKKRTELFVPWAVGTLENRGPVSMTHILSCASAVNMPTGLVPDMIEALADENSYNPAADWIYSRVWDGVDRLPAVCATLTPREGYPLELRDLLIRKWLLSIVAAATLPTGFKTRGVLTLQGGQGLGKTSWGLSLVDDPRLRDELVKVDHHLDAGNKDSVLGAIDHLIVEIGELDSSFRRDVARLKGFLTAGSDKVRRPYGRVAVETQRRTVFYATVNADDFLVDATGNSRWWTIPLVAIDATHGIDMQKVFAQCAVLLKGGAKWWLTVEEEAALEAQNDRHRSHSVVRDRLEQIIDPTGEDVGSYMTATATDLLIHASIDRPSNGQAKEAAALLRQWFGDSRRIKGRDKWRVPIRKGAQLEGDAEDKPAPENTKSKFD